MLRSVNIPVTHGRIELNDGVHSYPIFSSVDRTMTHGDDVYTSVLIPSGAFIPASAMYYSLANFDARFLNPTPDCVAGNCNTVGEQAAYNAMKDHLQLAHDYMADFLLVQYARHGPAYLDDSLRGRRVGGVIEEYVYPLFTDSERAAIIADVEAKLREIGDGNLDAGKATVIARVDRFILNK